MITSPHSKIISYLQTCYQSDNREEEILDVFDAKMEYCRIIEKKDVLFNGVLSRISLAGEDLPELEKIVILQEREKKLCLGFLLCTGILTLDDRVQKICSPLCYL